MRKTNSKLAPALSLLALSTLAFAQTQTVDEKTVQSFRADLAAKVKAADKNYDSVIQGKDGWMFFVPEVRSVSVGKFWGEDAAKVGKAVDPKYADPLPAILDFKAQLDKVGIKLLIVPVPPKSVIYADKIASGVLQTPRLDSAHAEFYNILREQGIGVLDLTSEFLQKRGNGLYCKQDTHWSGRGCVEAAQSIAASLRSTDELKFGSKWTYPWRNQNQVIKGDLWDSLPSDTKRPAQEVLPLRFVGMRDPKTKAMLGPVAPIQNSPVVLLGDSHTLVFSVGGDMHTKGAGLPDQLAYEFGFPVDLIGVRGSGATPARTALLRRARANPNYLKNKKWVIWCFSAREWTESAGWQKVPIVK